MKPFFAILILAGVGLTAGFSTEGHASCSSAYQEAILKNQALLAKAAHQSPSEWAREHAGGFTGIFIIPVWGQTISAWYLAEEVGISTERVRPSRELKRDVEVFNVLRDAEVNSGMDLLSFHESVEKALGNRREIRLSDTSELLIQLDREETFCRNGQLSTLSELRKLVIKTFELNRPQESSFLR